MPCPQRATLVQYGCQVAHSVFVVSRTFRLALLIAATLAGLYALATQLPALRAFDARWNACKAAPSAECLADLAVQVGLADRAPPAYLREAAVLPKLGRFDQAQALADHMRKAQVASGSKAPEYDGLASHRIAAHVRGGMTAEQAVAQVPDANHGALWIAGLDLLGRNPYGLPKSETAAPESAILAAVAGLADSLVAMDAGLNPHERSTALEYAAELRALLGDVDGAKAAVALLPKDIPDPLPLSATLTLVVGPDVALSLCPPQAQCREYALRFAAAAAPPDRAKALLTEAFDLGANAHYPDADQMRDTVETALDLGLAELALSLARRLDQVTVTRKGIFPVFDHLDAAHALQAAGADPAEVRAALARAKAELPGGATDTIVGFGVVSGPIAWDGSGLGAEALRSMALIHTRLGEVDQALPLIEQAGDPVYSWQDVLVADLPTATLDQLLAAASAVLPSEDFAFRRAALARDVLLSDAPDAATRDWAVALARSSLAEAPMQGAPALFTCEALAEVADQTADPALRDAALSHAARLALETGDLQSLLHAASLWHAFAPKL
jgi:hypothetical protein